MAENMLTVKDVCRHVRSKNAGPFWIMVDCFFDSEASYQRYRDSPAFAPGVFERLYGADPARVKRFMLDNLKILKISYPRPHPQGWMHERDIHGGQQYVPLLSVAVD